MTSSSSLPFHKNLLAGAVAGTVELLIMYPLDVVKTRFQLATTRAGGTSIISSLASLVRLEGAKVLYRGLLAPITAEAPKRAVKFSSNEFFKKKFSDSSGQCGQTAAAAAGVCAGLSEACVILPFDLVKIRMQAPENKGKYSNTLHAAVTIFQTEGARAFGTGLEATLWRHGLWNGGYFSLIFWLRQNLPKFNDQLLNNFVTGALAGTFGTVLNTPPDVVKTRIQNQVGGGPLKYRWMIPSAMLIAREEGVSALYKGFVPKVLRLGPGGGILLVAFEYMANLLR
eukprot:gnl/Spiro4/12042_TR6350_c0_g1_i1.p1 gnl/Spiro4/12042_TR6350_c0_g1~~gnl/Spiro4/12042_TR6350_c0_g1_i1.p1  ORF type:complete len:297 (+),score=66.12 gnl/Spiro4/12042_TR6350_c0_g1_i1:42-893(+)